MDAEWESFMTMKDENSDSRNIIYTSQTRDTCLNCGCSLERHEESSGTCDECLGFGD